MSSSGIVCILRATALLLLFVFGYLCAQAEYEAIKKFYPNLTFWEYVLLHNKLRITPNE